MMSNRVTAFLSLVALATLVPACAGNSANECDPACNAENFETCCEGVCVTLRNDEQNCGGCGIACSPGQYCESNTCMGTPGFDAGPGVDSGTTEMCGAVECPAGQRCCGTSCVNRSVATGDGRSDPSFMNCNGCGLTCDPEKASSCSVPGGGEGMPRCMCGEFNACDASSVCVNDATLGGWTCTNLSIDRNNCGEIGNACAEGESCSGGECVCGSTGAACPSGQACCAGACIDTSSDPVNCGGCGNHCTPNAPDCSGGSCTCAASGRACTAPTPGAFGIGGDPGESCCGGTGCVANTDESCGCMACTGEDTCQIGGSGIFPGMGSEAATVCCGGSEVAFLGCGGFPFPLGDGGFGLPGVDGGSFFPTDGGIPTP